MFGIVNGNMSEGHIVMEKDEKTNAMINQIKKEIIYDKKHPNNPNKASFIFGELEAEARKSLADIKAKCEILMQYEEDPVKKTKMRHRIEEGCYDFSDLI